MANQSNKICWLLYGFSFRFLTLSFYKILQGSKEPISLYDGIEIFDSDLSSGGADDCFIVLKVRVSEGRGLFGAWQQHSLRFPLAKVIPCFSWVWRHRFINGADVWASGNSWRHATVGDVWGLSFATAWLHLILQFVQERNSAASLL